MKKKILTAAVCAGIVAAFAGGAIACGDDDDAQSNERPQETLQTLLENAPSLIKKEFVDLGAKSTSDILLPSDGYSNGTPFGVDWNKNNVSFDVDTKTMELSVSKGESKYFGGEVKTSGTEATVGTIKYGYFSADIKPSDVMGTASTFFTYTGEHEGNPHDEIDIEFLGKDTTKVQFNYFVNGVGDHEYMYDLGFDASEQYHNYGFYWDDSSIIWYVDGEPVYGVSGKVPTTAQRLYCNAWAGDRTNSGIMAWMGTLNDEDLPATVGYRNLSAAYLNGRALNVPEPEYVPELSEFTASTIEFNKGQQDIYHVTTNADKTENTITYTEVLPKTYRNVYGAVDENVKAAEYIALKVKNNGTDDYVQLRIDVQSEKKNAAGINSINAKAWQDGDVVRTDLKYGGSFFEIEPGEEIVCMIKYYGIPSNVLLMLDSSGRTDKEKFAGSVTITDFMYAGTNTYVYSEVTLDTGYVTLKPGETKQLNATSTGDIEWSVDNERVATVKDGLITAVADGTAVITAKTGDATATCTVKVSSLPPKAEETMTIVADADDYANKKYIQSDKIAAETENTYGDSKEGIAWTNDKAYNPVYIALGNKYKLSADGYLEFFRKNVGTPNNGIEMYVASGGTRSERVQLYGNHNMDCGVAAGNNWTKWTVPLSKFSFGDGTKVFDTIIFRLHDSDMAPTDVVYIDGFNVVAEKDTSTPDPDPGTDPDPSGDKGAFVAAAFTDNVQYATITGDVEQGYTVTTQDRTYCRLRIPGKDYYANMFAGKTLEFSFKLAQAGSVTSFGIVTDKNTSSYFNVTVSEEAFGQNGLTMTYNAETEEYTVKIVAETYFTAAQLDVTQVRYFLLQINGTAATTELCTFTGMYIY